mgnify:CR=1 FL=1
MKSAFYDEIKIVLINILVTLQPIILLSVSYVIKPSDRVIEVMMIIGYLLLFECLILGYLLYKIKYLIPKEYEKSKRFQVFKEPFKKLDNQEKYNYFVALKLQKLLIDCSIEYLQEWPCHIMLTYKDKFFSINTKDYQGVILDKTASQIWEIGYGKRKINIYKKRVSVNNPFHENKRIMDRHYSTISSIENIVVVSNKTKFETKIGGLFYIHNLIGHLKNQ